MLLEHPHRWVVIEVGDGEREQVDFAIDGAAWNQMSLLTHNSGRYETATRDELADTGTSTASLVCVTVRHGM